MTGRRYNLPKLVLCLILIFSLSSTTAEAANPIPLIVKLKLGVPLLRVLDSLTGTLIDSIPGSNMYLVNVPRLPLVQPLLGLLGNTLGLIGIDWFEVNEGVTEPSHLRWGIVQVPAATAADWYKSQPAFQLIRAGEAAAYTTGHGTIVADINSRVDSTHPALIGRLSGGRDFVAGRPSGSVVLNQSSAAFLDQSSAAFLDQSSAAFLDQSSAAFLDQSSAAFLDNDLKTKPALSHGTLTAGVIAAVAPGTLIMPIRAFDDNGNADLFVLAKAIRYAADNGAHVINLSFGSLAKSKAMQDSISYAQSKGIVVVASAGNNNTSTAQYPAGFSGVLSVAATDLFDHKASFSNYGKSVFVDAPGVNIIAPFPGGYYAIVSGTSFSAPAVAAEAALIRSLRTTGISSSIAAGAVDIDPKNPYYVDKLGYGRIDVVRSVTAH